MSKLAAERFLLAYQGLDVRVLRLPFIHGDGDPHIREATAFMRGFPPAQRMSLGHHVDVAQAVALLLNAPSPQSRTRRSRATCSHSSAPASCVDG